MTITLENYFFQFIFQFINENCFTASSLLYFIEDFIEFYMVSHQIQMKVFQQVF
jgi:hypothetical protein